VPKIVVIGTKKEGLKITHATVTGYVRHSENGTPIINGNLYIEELQDGTTTDENGFYSIKLKKGSYTLVVSSLESEEVKYKMELLSSGNLNINLKPQLFLLDEFVVSSDKHHNVRGSQMGFEKLTTKTIKEIPVVLGEKDIIKVALLLPGVQSVGEGSTGFNVRGSPADQNLFYINTVPVYNSSHLFGFFSAFNSDAVSDFSLLKSNIPARYGGRLSSIFDISAKSGNMQHFSAQGGISPITARLVVEGPIVKEKASYMVGLRSTYSDWVLKMVKDPDIQNSSAYFGDAIANFTIKPNAKNEIKLFTYYSYDDANIAGLTQNTYRNVGGSIGWNHLVKEKHSLSLNFTTGNYAFEDQNMEYDLFAYKESFALNHTEIKASFTLRPNDKHAITIGLSSILYELAKGDFLPLNSNSSVIPIQFEPEQGIESGFFISDQWDLSPDWQISGGLRFNTYSYLGPK
ncbi:MAG: TonB-dependent receptor, partial [Cyclobacteriaceae bacterium]|nr:TonB-dependent receptor [Cyclobacteriaceae bacterium]